MRTTGPGPRFRVGYMHEDNTIGVIGYADTLTEAIKVAKPHTTIHDTVEHRFYDPHGIPEHLIRVKNAR